MMPRASWSEPLRRHRRRMTIAAALDLGTAAALILLLSTLAVIGGRAVLITLLNLTSPGLPPGCC
ncbi:hypothetical protein [Pseudogemmobacter humi]|uniref:Uncharacterized protein n=1 Tax=Pseudogemmobacter humi TaxID=2483812 RepID=A0A3P5XAF7_9RHOB|nr:hypothetical protein [Pseudogemmobacter humi]VDC28251.1 hypothetical protein XINFAN_02026 [Pseudogemmobacter humi]